MTSHHDVVIVGTGHAGSQTAIALRQLGFSGSIALIGAEPDLPYERPPLSKDYLAGDKAFERLLIRAPDFWEQRRVTMVCGRAVEQIDPKRRSVRLGDGTDMTFGQLVWAGGGNPIELSCPGAELAGVHSLRSRSDADAIRALLPGANRVAIIGGGYIGLEAAAVIRKSGKEVVLLEALDRVLSRVAGEPIGRFFEKEHRLQGVDVRTASRVAEIIGENGSATGVRLDNGDRVDAELIVVGIGIAAAVAPLLRAGADGGNGVHVDLYCRTSLPGIFAVGDCAAHENRFAGGARIRLESIQNAHDQATVAARFIVGEAQAYDALPWFWSNQYDLKLQTVGLFHDHDETVLRGDPQQRSFSLVYLKSGQVVALDCVNAVKDYVQGRALILSGATPDRRILADPAIPLKSLAE